MTEHTPGPWAWLPTADDPSSHAELLPAGHFIGEVDSILHHGADWPMKLPDMRLIAAAPTMYIFVASKAGSGDNEAIAIMEAINGNA